MTADVPGLDPGDVFVRRNIANFVHTSDMNFLSVLEYAGDHLAIQHTIVCGHYGCSGIARVLTQKRGALFDHWLQPLAMLRHKHQTVFEGMTKEVQWNRLCKINGEM